MKMNLKLMDKYIQLCTELKKQPSFNGMMKFKMIFR